MQTSDLKGRTLPFLLRLLAALPLSVLHGLGRALGCLAFAIPGRYRRNLQANAAQAGFADPAFAWKAAGETGAMMSELAKIWFRSPTSLSRVQCEDWEIIQAALAEGRGLILLTPHLGCFELAARYAAERIPFTIMFRPHRKAIFRQLLESVRDSSRMTAVPAVYGRHSSAGWPTP